MTYYTDIQSAQSRLLPPYASKRLLVRSPLSIIESLNPDKFNLWQFDPTFYDGEDTADYVYLVFFPRYTPEDDTFGEAAYKNTFARSAVFAPTTERRGFTVAITQPLRVFYDVVNRLVEISKTSSFTTHAPVKIIDFCRPEIGDSSNVISEGDVGTIRYGRIDIKKQPTFTREQNFAGIDAEYCLEPWEFKFSEAKLRSN